MGSKTVTWLESRIEIPAHAVNHASLRYGAHASASSCEKGFDADGAINGNTSLVNWGQGNGWKSAPFSWHPNWWGAWLRVDFSGEREIDTVIVRGYPQMVCDRPWASLKHYQVQCLDGEAEWTTLCTVRHNKDDVNVVRFKTTSTKAIRIWVNRNHFREESGYEGSGGDETPRILEVESYCLGDGAVHRVVTHEKVVEIGEKGSLAVFYDPAFCEAPSLDVMKLTAWLGQWGYGVTSLTADELCAQELFCRANFQVFIHPYGKSFPVGTNLYGYLQDGGHLISFGGRAFTAALQKVDGQWTDIGLDPGLTASGARYVDYFRPYREQLGIFTVPGSALEDVCTVSTNPNQQITKADVSACGSVGGWMALGMVGELMPIDETRQYAAEGRMPAINHRVREGISRAKADAPLLWGDAMDEDYGSIFSYPCARWVPLIDCFDTCGRNRGPAAALMPHYEGMYRGSHWAIFGVENADVLAWQGLDGLIRDVLDYMRTDVVAHSLEPSFSCYRQGEPVDFSVIVDNMAPECRELVLEFQIADCSHGGEVVFERSMPLLLQAGAWKRLDLNWQPDAFRGDLYKISVDIRLSGRVFDHLENGFAIWDESVISKGLDVAFRDNYFHFGDTPRYVMGARDSGMHMPWQPKENPIRWQRQYEMMKDYGMQITSPVHLDWCIPGLGWGEFDDKHPIPEILLRRMDAQVQIAQKNRLIYAPCIFFCYENIALQKPEIAKRICQVLGERYKTVPGILFYLFDDSLRHDPDRFNSWAKQCVDGFNACGRTFMVTAEMGFRQIWPDAMRRSAGPLTFSSGSVFQQSVGDPAYERLIDLRPVGKSFTMGEFVRRIPVGTAEDFHGYLAPPHVNFGMGNAMGLNWKWSTPYHTIWPSDVVFPCSNVPKKHLWAYRNESLFFQLFQPYYKPPTLMVVMPSGYWLKNSEALTRYMVDLLRKLLEARVDFACIDDEDIGLLPEDVKALILPLPLELPESCYEKVRSFAKGGGYALVIGDLGRQGAVPEGATSAQWLEELCGVASKGYSAQGQARGRSLFMDRFLRHSDVPGAGGAYFALSWLWVEPTRAKAVLSAADGSPVITRAPLGSGQVWFMNDLGVDFPPENLRGFFQSAGIGKLELTPDIPTLHCFRLETYTGPVYTLFTFPWDTGKLEVELNTKDGAAYMLLKDQAFGVLALTQDETAAWALETQGRVALNGREIADTDGHIFLAALDKVDIAVSQTLLLLPVNTGTVEICSAAVDTVESGEIVSGKWNPYSQNAAMGAGPGRLRVELEDPSLLYLLYCSGERDRAVALLESSIN